MNTVYVGSFPSFSSGLATFTNKSMELTVQKVEMKEQKEEKLIILKKDIVKAEACFLSCTPFFSLKVKYATAQKIRNKMGFVKQTEEAEEKWFYDTKIKQGKSDVGWIVVFINLSREFVQFFIDFLPIVKFLEKDDIEEFFQAKAFLGPECFLHKLGEFTSEPKSNITRPGPGGVQAFFLQMETALKLRMYASYFSSITDFNRENSSFTPSSKVKIDSYIFSDWFLNPLIEKYAASLYCSNCGADALLKCTWCKSVR